MWGFLFVFFCLWLWMGWGGFFCWFSCLVCGIFLWFFFVCFGFGWGLFVCLVFFVCVIFLGFGFLCLVVLGFLIEALMGTYKISISDCFEVS